MWIFLGRCLALFCVSPGPVVTSFGVLAVQAIFNSAQSVAHPPVDFAWKKYLAVHDAVVVRF